LFEVDSKALIFRAIKEKIATETIKNLAYFVIKVAILKPLFYLF